MCTIMYFCAKRPKAECANSTLSLSMTGTIGLFRDRKTHLFFLKPRKEVLNENCELPYVPASKE